MQEAIRISFGDPPVEYGLPGLLPQRFGPADLLGDSGAPLLLQPQHNRVAFAAGSAAAALEHSATAAVAAAKQPSEACPPLPAVSTENGVALTNGRGAAPEAAQRPAQPRQNGGAGVWGPLEAAAKRALQAANEVRPRTPSAASRLLPPSLNPRRALCMRPSGSSHDPQADALPQKRLPNFASLPSAINLPGESSVGCVWLLNTSDPGTSSGLPCDQR